MEMHLREAVETLGYFRADRTAELADIFQRLWPTGLSSTVLFYNDLEPMSAEEKDAVGAPRTRIPKVLWPLFSEKGRLAPVHGGKATTLRMIFNLRRAEGDQQEVYWGEFCSFVSFAARGEHICDRARGLDGVVTARQDRWALPLADCQQEWCCCRWDHVAHPL